LDTEFLALSFAFILIGVTGIVLFNGPMTPAGDSCYCIIPSPEPGAAQGTASIILAFGILFLPIGGAGNSKHNTRVRYTLPPDRDPEGWLLPEGEAGSGRSASATDR